MKSLYKHNKNLTLILAFVFLVIILGGFYLLYKKENKISLSKNSLTETVLPLNKEAGYEYTVLLDEDGFHPEEIDLYEGQTVKFVTTTKKDFWPASNLHPSHGLYPTFDPKKPVSYDGSWSFTFKDSGEYRYHDHLSPLYTGTVKVLSLDNKDLLSNLEDCTLDTKNDSRCWDFLMQKGWKENGVVGAFKVISYLFENEPEFLVHSTCHRYVHNVGDWAVDKYYKDLDNYENWEFETETFFCGYGFFHGLFEHLFRKIDNVDLAIDICDSLTKRFSKDLPSIRRNCYHGMGHGFMPDAPPKKDWGDPFAVTKKPLLNCARVSKDIKEVRECYQGIFNVLADWIHFDYYGFTKDAERPFLVCKSQKTLEHQAACYYEFAMRVPSYSNNDLELISKKFLTDIEDDEIARMIINSASATLVERNPDQERILEIALTCRKVQERVRRNCLYGVIGGLMAHGDPGKEYIKVIDLCSSGDLKTEEKSDCYESAFRKFSNIYNKEKRGEACSYIKDKEFNKQCSAII